MGRTYLTHLLCWHEFQYLFRAQAQDRRLVLSGCATEVQLSDALGHFETTLYSLTELKKQNAHEVSCD